MLHYMGLKNGRYIFELSTGLFEMFDLFFICIIFVKKNDE